MEGEEEKKVKGFCSRRKLDSFSLIFLSFWHYFFSSGKPSSYSAENWFARIKRGVRRVRRVFFLRVRG
jgi:hypothetical protein